MITLQPGWYTLTRPNGEIQTFIVKEPQTMEFATDDLGSYTLRGPSGEIIEEWEVTAPEPPVAPSLTVIPESATPNAAILITAEVDGLLYYWGNLKAVKQGQTVQAVAPSVEGAYPVGINGQQFATLTVVAPKVHNAKVNCDTPAEAVQGNVSFSPPHVKSGGQSILTVCFTNYNNVTAEVTLPRVALPKGFTSDLPIEIPSRSVAANGKVCRNFVVSATNSTQNPVELSVAVLQHSATLTVAGVPPTPELALTKVQASNFKAKVGASYYVDFTFENPLAVEVTLTVAQFSVPSIVTVEGASAFAVTIPAHGWYTHRLYCVANDPGAATFSIPSGAATATIEGKVVQIGTTRATTVTQIL